MPINFQQLQNDLYQIKETKSPAYNLLFVDFLYSTSSTSTNTSPWTGSNSTSSSYPNIVSPNVFSKAGTLNEMSFSHIPSVEEIKREFDKIFIKIISELGEKNRKNCEVSQDVPLNRFDIYIDEMERKGTEPARGIVAKINNIGNYIAVNGRIGPAQYVIMNNANHNYFSKYIGNVLTMNNIGSFLGNIQFIINNDVENDIILLGRKNSPDQPGVICIIMVDENNDIIINEETKNRYTIQYNIIDLGSNPETNFFKSKTRSLAYHRNKKLQRIKEIYG